METDNNLHRIYNFPQSGALVDVCETREEIQKKYRHFCVPGKPSDATAGELIYWMEESIQRECESVVLICTIRIVTLNTMANIFTEYGGALHLEIQDTDTFCITDLVIDDDLFSIAGTSLMNAALLEWRRTFLPILKTTTHPSPELNPWNEILDRLRFGNMQKEGVGYYRELSQKTQ